MFHQKLFRPSVRFSCRLGIVLGSLLVCGCGGNEFNAVPVAGVVTFAGQSPPAAGTIYFAPSSVRDGASQRPASANFGTDGRFQVTSLQPGDGLLPGNYRVRIECWKEKPKGTQSAGVSYIAAGYAPPEVVIGPDQTEGVELKFNAPLAAR
jgi:hypothetical protein